MIQVCAACSSFWLNINNIFTTIIMKFMKLCLIDTNINTDEKRIDFNPRGQSESMVSYGSVNVKFPCNKVQVCQLMLN